MKYKFFLLATCYLLVATWFYGCATLPRRPEFKPPRLLENKAFRIGRTKYVYLKDLCRAYDLTWDWDILGKRITLYREGIRIDLALGSSWGLINEQKIELDAIVKSLNNQLAIPFVLTEKLASILYPTLPKRKVFPPVGIYKIKRIVIDPGHGGRDPGAISPDGLREKDIVLNIAQALKKYLQAQGMEVILTREDDRFVSLWRRTHIANIKKADLFLSIHANSSRGQIARGFEVYYLSEKMDDSTRALSQAENAVLELEGERFSTENTALAATLWDLIHTQNRAEAIRLANYISKHTEKLPWLENRGVKGALFYVLKGANMPAILIETGFISNLSESRRLEKESYRNEIVRSIGQGILEYREKYERTDGFTR